MQRYIVFHFKVLQNEKIGWNGIITLAFVLTLTHFILPKITQKKFCSVFRGYEMRTFARKGLTLGQFIALTLCQPDVEYCISVIKLITI